MRSNYLKTLQTAVLAVTVLLLGASLSFAQSSVNLTAGASTANLPDGQAVPMWGYTCTGTPTNATCVAANPNAGTGWSPVVITVPYTAAAGVSTTNLTISLTNSLPVPPGGTGIPTSLVIVGQLGGGLGTITQATAPGNYTDPPDHTNAQPTTWPIADPTTTGTPPTQVSRVQSFSIQVANGATTPLTWSALKPGTYLIESGTHPSIQGPMGLYGVLVVTTAPGATAGTAYPGVPYNAEVPLVLSEIDPVQNSTVAAAVATAGFSETAVWSGQPTKCGNPASTNYHTCYPPAVNYDPRYYLVNGVSFDRTAANLIRSSFAASPATATGTVLVRFVNAGLRMHIPSIVGAQTNGTLPSGAASVVPGFSLIAEDGNVLPDVSLAVANAKPLGARVQSEVFMAAGKTYDVLINAPATGAPALPVFDRDLALSTNNQRDGGMQAFIGVNGSVLPAAGLTAGAVADNYFVVGGGVTVTDPAKGVIANDIGVYGVKINGATPTGLILYSDGTFTYTGPAGVSFGYCGNGATSGALCTTVSLNACTGACSTGAPTANPDAFPSSIASRLQIAPPGVLANDTDPAGHPLTAVMDGAASNGAVTLNADGSFVATPTAPPTGTGSAAVTFQYHAVNSQGTSSAPTTATVTFSGGSGLTVTVLDAQQPTQTITDYRWIIEEDRTFYIPGDATQTNTGTTTVAALGTNFHTSYMPLIAAGCVGTAACEGGQTIVDPANPLGTHAATVCDIGNGVCRPGLQQTAVSPNQVHLDPLKRYYLTIFPGDAGNDFTNGGGAPVQIADQAVTISRSGTTLTVTLPPGTGTHVSVGDTVFINGASGACNGTHQVTSVTSTSFTYTASCSSFTSGAGTYSTNPRVFNANVDCPLFSRDYAPGSGMCGHTMGGKPIAAGQTAVTVLLQPTPLPTAKVAVFVFEDDSPLNGEVDVHGGTDTMGSALEPGLGGFEITLFDDAGGTGDATGQMTYDMFNMPLSNSLQGMTDPATGADACPISQQADANADGLVGMIITCPAFESDGVTHSPLEGQAVIAYLMPGRYGVVATPAADRIGRGEEWLQTNTLDGEKGHDSFIKVGGPAYFQEFGPAGYHVAIGMANPGIINARGQALCATTSCGNSVSGIITNLHYGRPPDEHLYSSGTRDSLSFTQCYVSLGDTDGDDIAFTKCNPDGTFTLSGIPSGIWRLTVFDQWNDQIVDGLASAITLPDPVQGPNVTLPRDLSVLQWHTNIYTSTFFDADRNGVRGDTESGLALVPVNIRFRDGSYSNFNNTDLNGFAGFNEVFPLFSWYVIEADTTRYKQTGVHVVYDAGGPVDCADGAACSTIAGNFANTTESATAHLPTTLRFPGSVYCALADCPGGIAGGSFSPTGVGSTGRIDPPWVTTEGWQGFSGQNSFIEFGKAPYNVGENGGIHGEVIYASTRPFDDPALLIHTSWTPDVPGVTINLYQEGTATDGTQSLKLVDHTATSSFDAWAQGFRSAGIPNMNCPGQENQTKDLFFYTIQNSTNWLSPGLTLPNSSQFKCYDGMHMFNQIQPAPYDGMYQFPSVTARTSAGVPASTNCTICGALGNLQLPAGKYVVEMIVPPGYELVKEEDKNILIGDNYIAPVTQQFGGLASIFIMPDQAAVGSTYNANNPQNPTTDFANGPRHEGDTGSVESFWPCVGAKRIVPDYISLFPYSFEVAPFAGATRNLCDRKEVTLEDQSAALAKFWVFSSAHVAAHFTGFILDDFSAEFDPYSPQFGEKFAVPNLPISIKDFAGNEVSRVYSDEWGQYNGLNYSTWEVNPPNPTGYAPTMMVTCMNDPGPVPGPGGAMVTDPLYNPAYSQFCYETPFMPGQTQYMDTPVVPTSAFADGYNPPDCAYPDTTPAILRVDGNGQFGPWVTATGQSIAITALGDQLVPNHAYNGPAATTAPYNAKFITRHYGFGTQCSAPTAGSATCNTASSVTFRNGGTTVAGTITSWSDTRIVVTVPSTLPLCQPTGQVTGTGRQQIYHGSEATDRCGELVITAGNGKTSIDTVTVTAGGATPTFVNGENANNNAIQTAIDSAAPGALILVNGTITAPTATSPTNCTIGTTASVCTPGNYNEMLLMWKPVRLQGVGAASVIVNASTHPSGKMDGWRARVNCLFGAAINGGAIGGNNPFDPSNTYSCPANQQGKSDPIPLEPTLGWDANLNGNLAEILQEPTLMGAYEGAGITVLAHGVTNGAGIVNGDAPILLTNTTANCTSTTFGPSNFLCNPSRVDGLTFTNSSQGGGGIFLHGWNHFTEVSNNRVHSNAGTLTGGITVGQVETPDGTLSGNGVTDLAFGFNNRVNVHNNAVTLNASYGDEINSTTPSAAGGVTFCTGSDNYQFNNNWVCGNISSGDGGGVAHFGFSYNGNISRNVIIFNQSNNPTLPTYGGGVIIQGVPPDGTFCENTTVDQDCAPQLAEGSGPNTVIDANLIMGNTAESGKGGGLRLQLVNGTDVQNSPASNTNWYTVNVTNNIISNNVAGWAGGGVSLQDALKVNFINNTVVSNDATGSAGVLFNTDAATQANVGPPNCTTVGAQTTCQPITTSQYEPAGLETALNTSNLRSVQTNLNCSGASKPAGCFSRPVLTNDLFWQNRSFFITVGGLNPTIPGLQNTVSLLPTLNQAGHPTGYCAPQSGANNPSSTAQPFYWDLGAYGDTGPSNHSSGVTLQPRFSVLTDAADYTGASNIGTNPLLLSQYCNGSRKPPEAGGAGFNVPPGIADAVLPNPLFDLLPSAVPDEGNQWINMDYGPLSLVNSSITSAGTGYNAPLGNYSIATGSPAHNAGTTPPITNNHDFFGNLRPVGQYDIGAVELTSGTVTTGAGLTVLGGPLAFGNWASGTTSGPLTLTFENTGSTTVSVTALTFSSARFSRSTTAPGSCGAVPFTLTVAAGTCTVNVVFSPNAAAAFTETLNVTATGVTVVGSPVALSGNGVAAAATVSIGPNPLTITLPTGVNSGTGVVSLTNTAPGGGAQVSVSSVAVSGGSMVTFFFIKEVGQDGCSGAVLPPGGTCTVGVRFTNVPPFARGVNRAGTITFTDNATGSPQAGTLTGHANP
jgi:hypothetical protein